MPSGAKKRKAAKKKMENQNQSNIHSDSASAPAPAHPHGEDDRESDVGEVSSPMSQDHQKLPMEGEDEEIEKDSEVMDPSSVGVEESVTRVEKEIKIEDELGKKDGIIDPDDEANRASYDGGSSGSSGGSSSSDDESHEIKKGQAESSIASVGSVEVADSLSGKSAEPACDSPTAEDGDSAVETIPAPNSEKITVSSEQVELDVLSPADIAVAPHVIESTLIENGKKKCCSVKERICTSEPSVNAASHGKEEANAQSSESTPTTLDQKARVTQENADRSTSPYIASTAAVDNGAQHMKDSVVTTQPVAAPSPYPIQKTSWKGCCGLFEVFSASGA